MLQGKFETKSGLRENNKTKSVLQGKYKTKSGLRENNKTKSGLQTKSGV